MAAGGVGVLYALGLGVTTTPLGVLNVPSAAWTLGCGGAPGRILFAGLTPGWVGLYQINFALPATLAAATPGPVTCKLTLTGGEETFDVYVR
jgi:uncharacterized protein (TIGR03437 family)